MENGNDIQGIWIDFVNGDDSAYETIYNRYVSLLFSYGSLLCGDGELVKDCIQDVFVNIYKKRPSLEIPVNPKVYLITALRNSILNSLSRQSRQEDYRRRQLEKSDPLSGMPTVEETYMKAEADEQLKDRVRAIMSLLKPRQREIIYHRFVEGLDYDEICSVMQINYQSAHNLIQRSLKKIREHYKTDPA